MCLYGDCYGGRGLVRDCDARPSVGAADVPVVPAKGDVTIRLNWWGGDARIKAMIAELQESIDFNS